MESMMKLPDDMFKQELLVYLTIHDIVQLDNSCMNHTYRPKLLDKISGAVAFGDADNFESIETSLFEWLGIRCIYLMKMLIAASGFYSSLLSIENDYIDQFRYTQHVKMRGPMRDDMAIFIISHCPCLLSIDFSKSFVIAESDFRVLTFPKITCHTLQSISEHCTKLQSLSLNDCNEIRDTGLTTVSEHCPNLSSLRIDRFNTLQSLNLNGCLNIEDASIISISTHCTGL